MKNRIKLVLQEECGLRENELLLLGVSGGADSLFLLDVLSQLDFPLIVAHLDHALRLESASDARAVRQFATERGVKCYSERVDAAAYAHANRLSIEEAARIVRYRFLFQVAEREGASAVVVGHNADDQVETVLMHLLRGAGLSGLRGMSYRSLRNEWSDVIPLLRPLLGIWRDEVNRYLDEKGLVPLVDNSNLDTRYYRNRLRHDLIPYLEQYNPQARKLLWQMADNLRDDYEVIETAVDKAWEESLIEQGNGFLGFSVEKLAVLPRGIRRHMLRRAIYLLRPDFRDVDYDAIQHAMNFIESGTESRQCDLLAGLYLLIEGDSLWLADYQAKLPDTQWPQLFERQVAFIAIPGMLRLKNDWIMRVEIVSIEKTGSVEQLVQSVNDPFHAYIDGDLLSLPLMVRARREGDRILPLGLGGHSIKVSDLMVNEKIPRRARKNWPLLLSDDEIVWIPGLRVAHPYRVRKDSKKIVRLILSREKNHLR